MPNPIVNRRIPRGRTVPAVSPADFAGLLLWLKADSIVLNDSDPIASWSDSSGNGHTHVQTTALNKPLFKTGQQNGNPGVLFDGIDDYMIMGSGNLGAPTSYSMFIVLKLNLAVGVAGIFRYGDGTNFGFLLNTGNRQLQHQGISLMTDGVATTNPEIWEAVRTTAPLAKVWVNGSNQTIDNSTSALNSVSNDNTFLGFYGPNPPGFPMSGLIYEVILYDNALSDTDRASIESYLNTKYAIY